MNTILAGLGDINSMMTTPPATNTPTTTKKNAWDVINTVLDIGQKASDIYKDVKTNTGNSGSSTGNGMTLPSTMPNNNTPQQQGMSNGIKIAIGVGIAAAIVGIVVIAKKSKKKK